MQNGLVTALSALSYEETCNKIIDLIESNPNLKILLDLDHAENASKVDKELLPTRLIMFGNPNVGTLLMQKQQTIGIDLPQKILIFQNDSGKVFVSYNAPQYLADRHDIFGMDEVLIKIHGLLSSLVENASK